MNRTDRLYAIVEELRVAGSAGRTAAALAARFEVAPRTIKRDISALQQAGASIWATAGPGGGYVLDAAVTLPPLAFTAAEATAIAIALGAQADRPFGPEARSALVKVLGAMQPDARAAADRLASRVWIRTDEIGPERGAVASVIDDAMRREVVVVLDYVDAQGNETERRPVEPMLFARRAGHWYLLAWCRRRRDGRWFRLDRIAAAHLTTEHVEARDMTEVFGAPPSDAAPITLA
jgi:predicted DNA-binding transcriptional regulator YafY